MADLFKYSLFPRTIVAMNTLIADVVYRANVDTFYLIIVPLNNALTALRVMYE